MSFSTNPRKTKLLKDMPGAHATRPLHNTNEEVSESSELVLVSSTREVNAPGTSVSSTRVPLVIPAIAKWQRSDTPVTSTKPPVVIPATTKRQSTDTRKYTRQSSSTVLLGVFLGLIAMLTITSLFVAPLDSGYGQQSQSLAQSLNDLFSRGHASIINTALHVDPPTPTPALRTTEGYCGGSDIWGKCATAVTASGVMGTGQMQRPIRGAIITQVFGNPEYQPWCGCWRPHTGIDLAAPYGTPIMAADNGQVIWTGWDWSGLGWAIKINHGHYIATIYGHLQRFIVNVGQNVTRGQTIGFEGSTGASTGPHLHFMVLYNNFWVNPVDYVQLP